MRIKPSPECELTSLDCGCEGWTIRGFTWYDRPCEKHKQVNGEQFIEWLDELEKDNL